MPLINLRSQYQPIGKKLAAHIDTTSETKLQAQIQVDIKQIQGDNEK
ncbi:MAG: hypothetical protein HC836_13060 [Richelia sp. RM2_1_2]|nr:hypothetical protein [Richelia sp. RM1_1_1]NJO59211.1 hypothetical protein [Richelia sp. RM2_1_2]